MDKNQETIGGGDLDGRQDFDARIASRVKALRLAGGFTIDGLAEKSGVSRAMISKIERGDVSPTAVLLAKLSNALDVTLSQLFRDGEDDGMLVRAASRRVWRDPATGYIRRNVSPVSSPVDIVDVTLPPGAQVTHDNAVPLHLTQLVWVFEGQLTMSIDGFAHVLGAGDCLQMRLDRPISFQNQSVWNVRYAVILARGSR
jgi:transcriptional regulator with XRE-family HTH domain